MAESRQEEKQQTDGTAHADEIGRRIGFAMLGSSSRGLRQHNLLSCCPSQARTDSGRLLSTVMLRIKNYQVLNRYVATHEYDIKCD